ASDGHGGSATATVALTVTAVNDPPTAGADSATTDEDVAVTVAVLANDTDVDGDALAVSSFTQGGHGSVTANAGGTLMYMPAADYYGIDAFTYTISDGHGGTDTATVTVTVRPVNDAPVAANDSYTVAAGATLQVAAPGVLGNDTDVDGDALSAALV